MKNFLFLVAVSAASLVSVAQAADYTGKLVCEGGRKDFAKVSINAEAYYFAPERGETVPASRLTNVVVVWQDLDSTKGEPITARSKVLNSDEKYTARKYTEHFRYDLDTLIDTKDFSNFYPNGCSNKFVLPWNAWTTKGTVRGVIQSSCEQSGAVTSLSCRIDNSRARR